MQLTSKFFFLAVVLVYGGATVSALPVGESQVLVDRREYASPVEIFNRGEETNSQSESKPSSKSTDTSTVRQPPVLQNIRTSVEEEEEEDKNRTPTMTVGLQHNNSSPVDDSTTPTTTRRPTKRQKNY